MSPTRMAQWDEYARNETAFEKGRKEGKYEKSVEVVKNMLATGKYTIAEIAKYIGVTEEFVRKVQKNMK
ncbi:MAG TPA: hypothetical protein VF008_27255 [Niastella sp.]